MQTSKRITFLDLARLFALFMMVQGHTIYDTLDDSYRDLNNTIFSSWRFMRGFTAPIFLFIAGTVLVYLLKSTKKLSTRLKKGLKRSVVLLIVGYWLNSSSFFRSLFYEYSFERGMYLFRVDVLHLIAVGIMVLLGFFYLSKRVKISEWLLYLMLFIGVVLVSPMTKDLIFESKSTLFLTQYINGVNKSLFPIFPWLSYMLFGAIFGSVTGNLSYTVINSWKMPLGILISAGILYFASSLGDELEVYYMGESTFWEHNFNLVFYRLSGVLFIMSMCACVGIYINRIPTLFLNASKNSLWIYVSHLIVLGWLVSFKHTLSPYQSISLVVGMIILMLFVSEIIEYTSKRSGIIKFFLK